jgi:DNA repair exonuclease SbcCD ATPase subunit
MVNAIESVRAQLESLKKQLADRKDAEDAMTAIDELDSELIAVEEKLTQLKLTGRGQDAIRWPVQLGGQLAYLAVKVTSSDFPPTAQQLEVKAVLEEELARQRNRYEEVMSVSLPAFNRMLTEHALQGIVVQKP